MRPENRAIANATRAVGKSSPLLSERAYDEIRDRILTLQLPPGAPIDEEVLMRELSVGRTPIREAVRRLALEDLVTIYPRRGTFVSDINVTDLAHIADLRVQLEGHAAYRAAQASLSERSGAIELGHELEAAAGSDADAALLMNLDARVHRFVYWCSGNPYLASAAERYYNLSVRIWYAVLERLPRLPDTVLEHRALLQAIYNGEPDRARALAAGHVAAFAQAIGEAL